MDLKRRMTKEIAEKVAIEMTAEHKKNVEKLKSDYSDYVRNAYVKHIPKQIIDAESKFPDWFKMVGSISFSGHGFSYESVSIKPYVIATGYNANLELTAKLANEIMKRKNAYLDAKKKYEQFLEELKIALFSLRTFQNVAAQFPESLKFLPKETYLPPAVNFDDIRSKLKVA